MLPQVNRLISSIKLMLQFCRNTHTLAKPNHSKFLCPLEQRKLLKVSGPDASVFLQGLITNDMRHFDDGARSIYAMFLNTKGRVLFDTLIHRWEIEPDCFMVECDSEIINMLQKHLKIYKLKRSVDIKEVPQLKVWVLVAPESCLPSWASAEDSAIKFYKDPRQTDLGYRILSSLEPNSISCVGEMINSAGNIHVDSTDYGYKYLRYNLGISEGPKDLPPAATFPLEVNCDYLHGVSFHKGCYLGQELTARVYHTGVIRKRIMPLKFDQNLYEEAKQDALIVDKTNPKITVGKLQNCVNGVGLGLMRVKEALEAKELVVGHCTVIVHRPHWWPIEASKEKFKPAKTD